MIHEDERRRLEDWPEAKIITAKTDCILGNHYHKIKTERFILSVGKATITIDGESMEMIKGNLYSIYPNQAHSFLLSKGSVLIGLCSHTFNPEDDYR
jgi:quercetin dioxygenase-like cupin family protein